MKVLKYDRTKGSAPVQSQSISMVGGGNASADIAALNTRISMLESTILRISNELDKRKNYLQKGGDNTSGAYTFGSVKAERFDTLGKVEIFENNDEGKGYVRINGYANGRIPFVAKQGDYDYIDVTPRVEVKGVASVEGASAFSLANATEGMQIKFNVGYNTPSLGRDFSITLIRAYVGVPITQAAPRANLVPDAGEPTSHFWFECEMDSVSNTATFTVPYDAINMTYAVRVNVYYSFLTSSQISSATIRAWYDGTDGNMTYCTIEEASRCTSSQDFVEVMQNSEIGCQLRATGLYKTTDGGANWTKVV